MKFLTLENGQLGALIEQTVVDIAAAAQSFSLPALAETLLALVESGDELAPQVWSLAERALSADVACRRYDQVNPQAPIPVPRRNIFCLGKNYLDHARELAPKMKTSGEAPVRPIIFTKATTSVIGPDAVIPAHREVTKKLDYEAELALVIGTGGRDIAREQAWEHVFGYTIINDVTARDLQKDHQQWFRGKSLDGCAPMGPLLVHRSVMPSPDAITIQCLVNGEQRQQGCFDQLIFDVPEIVAVLSAGMTLQPGDIIATGTPAGVGMGFKPSKYLQPGDQIEISVTGAGTLRNRVG